MSGGDYMGCPENYYRKALQRFAHNLLFGLDSNKAKQMANEKSIEKLEHEIREQRKNVDIIDFIFDAGIVAGSVLKCADRDDGCDGFNACLGGISEFEEFVKEL